jgi:hypothetical protein
MGLAVFSEFPGEPHPPYRTVVDAFDPSLRRHRLLDIFDIYFTMNLISYRNPWIFRAALPKLNLQRSSQRRGTIYG